LELRRLRLHNLRLYVLRRLGLWPLRRLFWLVDVAVFLKDVYETFFDFEHMPPGGGPEKPYLMYSRPSAVEPILNTPSVFSMASIEERGTASPHER